MSCCNSRRVQSMKQNLAIDIRSAYTFVYISAVSMGREGKKSFYFVACRCGDYLHNLKLTNERRATISTFGHFKILIRVLAISHILRVTAVIANYPDGSCSFHSHYESNFASDNDKQLSIYNMWARVHRNVFVFTIRNINMYSNRIGNINSYCFCLSYRNTN